MDDWMVGWMLQTQRWEIRTERAGWRVAACVPVVWRAWRWLFRLVGRLVDAQLYAVEWLGVGWWLVVVAAAILVIILMVMVYIGAARRCQPASAGCWATARKKNRLSKTVFVKNVWVRKRKHYYLAALRVQPSTRLVVSAFPPRIHYIYSG